MRRGRGVWWVHEVIWCGGSRGGVVGACIHEVELCDYSHGALAVGVDGLGELHRIRGGDVGVGWRHSENDRIAVGDVLHNHVTKLRLNVSGLVGHWDLRDPREIDE